MLKLDDEIKVRIYRILESDDEIKIKISWIFVV